MTRYETLSTEVDYYFPNIQTVKQIQEKFNAFPRKQSVYFDASDYQSIEEVAVEASENLSDTEDQVENHSKNQTHDSQKNDKQPLSLLLKQN